MKDKKILKGKLVKESNIKLIEAINRKSLFTLSILKVRKTGVIEKLSTRVKKAANE
jgi:hypothetical protein